MKIDYSKPVRTKAGEKVQIITTEGRGLYPVVGYAGDAHCIVTWTLDGYQFIGRDEHCNANLENYKEAEYYPIIESKGGLALGPLSYPTEKQALECSYKVVGVYKHGT